MQRFFTIVLIAVVLVVGYLLFTGRAIPNEGSLQGAVQMVNNMSSGLPMNSDKPVVVDPSSSSRGGAEVSLGPNSSARVIQEAASSPAGVPNAADAVNLNGQVVASSMGAATNQQQMTEMGENPAAQALRLASCYPKDSLTAEELLPQDNASSQWAQVYPTGEGSLKDKNFLQSGYLRGIDTVGQTLRNANMQLRSEPPNPQVQVSPWLQSTIEPDVNRRPFEIGGC